DQGLVANYDDNGNGTNDPGTGANNGVDRDLNQTLQTLQPYVQLNIKPIAGLTLTPGIRYSWFDRNVNALVNIKTGQPQAYDNKFHSWLPSMEAHYEISPNWAAYAQVAKGFLAPNENFFTRNNPNTTSISPETTLNYQAGTTWHTKALSLSLDGYIIDFSNFIQVVGGGNNAYYTNLGGVTYKGLEAEGTLAVAQGVSVYANGSINSALTQATALNPQQSWVANAPKATAAGGLIYSKGGIYASLLAKWIGPRYGSDGEELNPFATADISFGFDLGSLFPGIKGGKLKININNITDNTTIINDNGTTVANNPATGNPDNLYWTNAGRSAFATLEFKL
ncbi:MAG: TonB-dependent receptor, partial [Alphaproteobacteria bacterium]|nr:TonB-dependent receptor [Alphaproteobacteria bacterium]